MAYSFKYVSYFTGTVDAVVFAELLIESRDRFGLFVIYFKSMANGMLVVVGSATNLSAEDKSLNQFLFAHMQVNYGNGGVACA